jgi:hypothetical protein
MLYGEGEKAFLRLQDEFLRNSNDISIFAWTARDKSQKYRGILAKSPAEFAGLDDIVLRSAARLASDFTMTNKGLRVGTSWEHLVEVDGAYVLPLNCTRKGRLGHPMGLYLKHHGSYLYARDRPTDLACVDPQTLRPHTSLPLVCISRTVSRPFSEQIDHIHRNSFVLGEGFDGKTFFRVMTHNPAHLWDSQRRLYLTDGHADFLGLIVMFPLKSFLDRLQLFHLIFGIDEGEIPWVAVAKMEYNVDEGPKDWLTTAKEMSLVPRDSRPRELPYRDVYNNHVVTVSVSLRRVCLDGEMTNYIDLDYKSPLPRY